MSVAHLTNRCVEKAIGDTTADRTISEVAAQEAHPETAWLRHAELAAKFGARSVAVRSYVVTLAKRAAAASVR
jgi:hypothetical protein